ncbi:MAG: hypothetical protein EP306_05160 [Burkholderiales bacterium]|nr:MAG: hypothetical protein EP306_05160 [Burkholderiales bacterium]
MPQRNRPVPVDQRRAWEIHHDAHAPLSLYGWRLLAEGDSWMSIGALNGRSSNLLNPLRLHPSTVVVNCAYPGDTMVRMARMVDDPHFVRLLCEPGHASFFEGILLSAGGNDLIDAAQIPPVLHGAPVRPEDRLLLTQAEASMVNPGDPSPARHLSRAGWDKLATYLHAALLEIVRLKDLGPSRESPLMLHTYAEPVVRRAGVMPFAPDAWLYRAMLVYDIRDQAVRQGLVHELFSRLRSLLMSFDQDSGHPQAVPKVHVFDASQVALRPADPDASGRSGDWLNEIHPTHGGYARIARQLGPWVMDIMHRYPGGRAYRVPATPPAG